MLFSGKQIAQDSSTRWAEFVMIFVNTDLVDFLIPTVRNDFLFEQRYDHTGVYHLALGESSRLVAMIKVVCSRWICGAYCRPGPILTTLNLLKTSQIEVCLTFGTAASMSSTGTVVLARLARITDVVCRTGFFGK